MRSIYQVQQDINLWVQAATHDISAAQESLAGDDEGLIADHIGELASDAELLTELADEGRARIEDIRMSAGVQERQWQDIVDAAEAASRDVVTAKERLERERAERRDRRSRSEQSLFDRIGPPDGDKAADLPSIIAALEGQRA